MIGARNAVVMTIDVDDSGQIDTTFMQHEITLKTNVRIIATKHPTSITSEGDLSRHEGECMAVAPWSIYSNRWLVYPTARIYAEVTYGAVIHLITK